MYTVALLTALVVVVVTRGSFRRLVDIDLRQFWALFLALALQIALEFDWLPEDQWDTVGFGLLMASYALVLAFVMVNLGRRGMGVILVGVLMNTVAIGVNRGMPYRSAEGIATVATVKHHPETDSDLVPWLGDIIVLPAPFDVSISFGDLVIAVGLVDLCFWASRRNRRNDDEGGRRDEGETEPEPEPQPGKVIVLDDEDPFTADVREPVAAGGVTTLWSMEPAPITEPTPVVRPPAWRDDTAG